MLKSILCCAICTILTLFAWSQGSFSPGTAVIDSLIQRIPLTANMSSIRNQVILQWNCQDAGGIDYFNIERKTSEKNFEVVGVIRKDSVVHQFEWIDDAAGAGRNLYRVSGMTTDGRRVIEGNAVSVLPGDISFKFYPNPVDNILIIRSSNLLEVQILDGQGNIKVPAQRVQGLTTMDVSFLEKGVYYLRLINKSTNVVSQEKLMKN